MNDIKKVIQNIYRIDWTKQLVSDKDEYLVSRNLDEFKSSFRRLDKTTGTLVSFEGYSGGLFYSNDDERCIYSSPNMSPEKVNFRINMFGLKRNSFYLLSIKAKTTGNNELITKNRDLIITTDAQELLVSEDLTQVKDYQNYYGIFKANSNEVNIFVEMGKICISEINIDEVELVEEATEEEIALETIQSMSLEVAAYGWFSLNPDIEETFKGKHLLVQKYAALGIALYFNKETNEFIIERDNVNDVLGNSFTTINYLVQINMNKVVYKDFVNYKITEVSSELSPNTLKQGYIKFALIDKNGENVTPDSVEGKINILVIKLF